MYALFGRNAQCALVCPHTTGFCRRPKTVKRLLRIIAHQGAKNFLGRLMNPDLAS